MRMKNKELIEHFLGGGKKGNNYTDNLRIERGNVLVNYETPIAYEDLNNIENGYLHDVVPY